LKIIRRTGRDQQAQTYTHRQVASLDEHDVPKHQQNPFTCDITKPFKITSRQQPAKFHLVTMWEVLEHIPTSDLPPLFDNITAHMARGGYFVASTTSDPDVHNGVDLHQTKWTNAEWLQWLRKNYPSLEPVNLGLSFYQFVRHNSEGSFLTLRLK